MGSPTAISMRPRSCSAWRDVIRQPHNTRWMSLFMWSNCTSFAKPIRLAPFFVVRAFGYSAFSRVTSRAPQFRQ